VFSAWHPRRTRGEWRPMTLAGIPSHVIRSERLPVLRSARRGERRSDLIGSVRSSRLRRRRADPVQVHGRHHRDGGPDLRSGVQFHERTRVYIGNQRWPIFVQNGVKWLIAVAACLCVASCASSGSHVSAPGAIGRGVSSGPSSKPTRIVTAAPTTRPTSSPTGVTGPTSTSPTSCSAGQVAARVTTGHASYSPGQPVVITAILIYSGPTCMGLPPWGCGFLVSVYNSLHIDVWDEGAAPGILDVVSCQVMATEKIVHGATDTVTVSWTQKRCTNQTTPHPAASDFDCPETQVPDGSYTVVAHGGAGGEAPFVIAG
jgi:hypothetical protein